MTIKGDMLMQKEVKIALKSAGFLTESGKYVEGLIDADGARNDYELILRHRLVRDEDQEATIDFIYETPSTLNGGPGHPCIYFKIVDDRSAKQIQLIRKRVWNSGRAPILWFITPSEVRIYDAFARPEEGDTEKSHILDVLSITSDGLEGVELFRRELFDTGKFWESEKGQQIDRNQRVDESLLDDLWDTERILTKDFLTEDKRGIPVDIAHALIGRSIFMAYLWDRKIITSDFLNARFEHRDIKNLLTDKTQLYKFFRWLRSTFNGDLFPIDGDEENSVNDIHLKIVREFFDGTAMSSIKIVDNKTIGQKRLWPYNFDIIPIELISSIYEMFAHSKDPIDARAKSIHYTKLHLVELVTSLAVMDLPANARVLDPACGSGVFLVDTFRRLVCKKRFDLGRPLGRDEICHILLTQIYGVDIERGAIELTAFSLYLALLELDESFTNPEDIKFPKLIYPRYEEGYYPTLYTQDIANTDHAFNRNEPFVNSKFDIIIGNLPWTKLKGKTAPRDPDNPISGRQWLLDYCKKKKIPYMSPDQAIMERVRDFANTDTIIAFIVSSRIFYQLGAGGKFWLSSFLEKNSIFMAINLSDISGEKILFGGISKSGSMPGMPGSVIFYNPQPPDNDSYVTYICPRWYPSIKKRGEIIIHPPDIQKISLILLRDNPHLWKIAFLGSQRDFELIKKLIHNPSLKDVLNKIGITDSKYGRGYFLGNKSKNSTKYIGYPNLEENEDYKYYIDSKKLPKFQYETLEAPREEEIYKAPLLIVRRSLKDGETRVAFTSEDTVYSSTYMGISFDGVDERYAHRINAVFNNKFILYLVFMLSRELGWFKRLIEPSDWREMPLPKSILNLEDERWDDVITLENKLCKSYESASSSEIKNWENSLFKSICNLYGLNEVERIIVDDMISYTIDLNFNRRLKSKIRGIKPPTSNQLEKYANRLCNQLNSVLEFEGKTLIYTVYDIEEDSPLSVVEFKQVSQTTSNQGNSITRIEGLEELLIKISKNLKSPISERIYILGHLRIYEGEHLYIIKPSEGRFWSESAALNDADAIIREHMEAVDEAL